MSDLQVIVIGVVAVLALAGYLALCDWARE